MPTTDDEGHTIALSKRPGPAIFDGWMEKKGENR